jgi:hypothetical protein
MGTVTLKNGRNIKVVAEYERQSAISDSDSEMDERAVQAVKSAINKAIICKKPVAKYDAVAKKAYIQYADGVKQYVE